MELQFNDISIDDKKLIESYIKPWEIEASDFSFTNMFIWGTDSKIKYTIYNDTLFFKLCFKGVCDFFWPPIPNKNSSFNYRDLVYFIIDYLKKDGIEPTIRSVSSPFKEMIEESCPELILTPTPITSDYVYLSEALIGLKGKKLHGKRNHLNKFKIDHPDFKYVPLKVEMYDECMSVYNKWIDTKSNEKKYLDEKKSVNLALKYFDKLNLTGGCIIIDEEIKAFTVGERLTPDMHLIHIEKADSDINGLYTIINQLHAEINCGDVTFINREEDMGIEGLRRAKQSYHPIKMIDKHLVSLIPATEIKNLWGR